MKNLILSLILFLSFSGYAQISFENPSFEKISSNSDIPKNWKSCSFLYKKPPIIHTGHSIAKKASDGLTYIGLLTHPNSLWSSIMQKLTSPLQREKCYEFSIDLFKSNNEYHINGKTGQTKNFIQPVRLRIWGGNSGCVKNTLLAETALVKNKNWEKYNFSISPSINISNIIIEAYYEGGEKINYSGNIQIDNISDIVQVDCNKDFTQPVMSVLKNSSSFIEFLKKNKNSFKLKKDPYLGNYIIPNLASLHEIANYLKQNPNTIIVFGLQKSKSNKEVNAIVSMLSIFGTPYENYEIKYYDKKTYKNLEWIVKNKSMAINIKISED